MLGFFWHPSRPDPVLFPLPVLRLQLMTLPKNASTELCRLEMVVLLGLYSEATAAYLEQLRLNAFCQIVSCSTMLTCSFHSALPIESLPYIAKQTKHWQACLRVKKGSVC